MGAFMVFNSIEIIMEALLSEFISSRFHDEIAKLEAGISDTISKLKKQEDQLRKEIKDKNDIFKNFVKEKIKLCERENQILNLLKDKKSHEEIEDFIKISPIQDLLKTSNISSSDPKPKNVNFTEQTKHYPGKECYVKIHKVKVADDENHKHEKEADISKADNETFNQMFTQAEQLLQEHFGDVSRISTILDGDHIQEDLEESDQAEIADEDLIEQLLKDDNEIYNDITENSLLLTSISDDDFDEISTSSVNEPIEVPKISTETIPKSSNSQQSRKRKFKER